jgi:predicted component of type VI protein secretion system
MDDDTRAAFEAKVIHLARRFDVKCLIDLLVAKGYPREDILFEGTHEGASLTLVEAISFRRPPSRGVLITLNMGLLGDNSLLPSYFFQLIEGTRHPERFFDFIRFFDHRLIESFLRSVYPEGDPGMFPSWDGTMKSFLKMLGPGSVSTLNWLAQLYFPELGVRATRWAFTDNSDAFALRTGESTLDGTGILGRSYQSEAAGISVELFAEEETDARARAWPNIVRGRLNELLLPLLAPFRIPLCVRLHVTFHASWARVDVPYSLQHGYLGYERIKGDPESGHTTTIYRGVTGIRTSA